VGNEVEVEVSDLMIAATSTKPICDAETRRYSEDTLAYFRLEEVCKIVLEGYRNLTD
jgi:hypothetical protein